MERIEELLNSLESWSKIDALVAQYKVDIEKSILDEISSWTDEQRDTYIRANPRLFSFFLTKK